MKIVIYSANIGSSQQIYTQNIRSNCEVIFQNGSCIFIYTRAKSIWTSMQF